MAAGEEEDCFACAAQFALLRDATRASCTRQHTPVCCATRASCTLQHNYY